MVSFATIRLGVYITIALFSLVVLGLAGHIVYGLGIATAVLTLVVIIPVLVIDHLRRGTFFVWTAVELGWLFVLWVLWIATGGDGASAASLCNGLSSYDYLGYTYYVGLAEGYCHELQAATAFAFLNWIMMFGMFIYILVMAVRAQQAGYPGIWQDSLMEYKANPNIGTAGPGTTYTQPTAMTSMSNEPKYATGPAGPGMA
ncbi:hypothetical protein DACRYDRAFT_93134 [Dacryopinax primogenitus]|uniref:MARVEL domain-containing protein n=1 Tax=Dacryopinax primogenitus (strain DJM 731) TaxID=1858805 RepID=M5G365_DACPD|nr:uncharacterized protein DACRYDRAFT_93134 [Dacryopinax primogenitus]EJU04661.1 hypothetical protein DACRYDRAFT_93134 [Dacryopinax primogenitus]